MLIRSHRHSRADLDAWEIEEETDRLHVERVDLRAKAKVAMQEIARFAKEGPGYVGVSWGKDSVVVAHLTWLVAMAGGPSLPLVWVRVEDKENPDCPLVRDHFLSTHPRVTYEEIEAPAPTKGLTSSLGFAEAARRHGDRHISGVRAEESAVRKLRTMRWGLSTEKTCAPIAWWTHRDVFAYLLMEDLPVHPAYACLMGGILERRHLRVAAIGGKRGTGHGRAEWERRYYPEAVA